MNQYCTEVHVHSSTRSEAITGTCAAASEKRERGGDRLSPAPIKDRQAVDGGDQRLRETVGDCEPDRLERERERTIGFAKPSGSLGVRQQGCDRATHERQV